MNKSLTSDDFELVLDAQTGDCPAVVKERLFETPPDQMPIDFARINNKHCWVVSSHDVYVWSLEQNRAESRKSRLAHLRLPPSGLVYSSKLICVFDKPSEPQNTVSVLGISREGVVRYWPTLGRDAYVDSVLDLNREVVLDIHLLENSVTNTSAEFILVTTSGSVYTMACTSKGEIAAYRIGNRETQGMATRISSFIFGNGGSHSDTVRATGSAIFLRESEEINSMDEETLEPVAVILGSKSIFAYDITNKSEVWTADVKELLGDHVIQTLKMSADLTTTSIRILDAQCSRKGLLVLLAATTASSDSVFFFLAHLVEFDYRKPKIGFFAEVPTSNQIEGMFDATDESSFVGQIYLCIPKNTANCDNMSNTDGVVIVHPVFVETVFIPNDDNSEINFSKAIVMATNEQIIGYGTDDNYCYAMLTDGRISSLRLLPRGFEGNSMADDICIVDVLANTDRPLHDKVGQALYDAFAAFCSKDLTAATTGMQALNHTTKNDFLKNVRNFLWSVVQDIDNDCDLLSELREKKKFCEYFILFLKHTEVLNFVLEAKMMHPQFDCIMTGNEILSEISERLQVLITLVQWQSVNPDHDDVLGHIVKDIVKDGGYRRNDKELRFEYVHLIPRSVVRLCQSLIHSRAFKSASQRYETLCLGADILYELSVAVAVCRRMGNNFPINRNNTKWTTALAEYYAEMCLLLLEEFHEPSHGDIERKKFKDYATKLVTFHLSEVLKQPDGHAVLNQLAEIGDVKETIELAERFKDFKTLCWLTLLMDKTRRNAKLDSYKVRFASDDFESYLYNYMNKQHMYDDLLNQKGERADKFISTLDHIRWRRELQQGDYSDAGKTLLVECERETASVEKQKTLASLARLAFLCQEENDQNMDDLDDIDLNQRMIQYQESLPEALIKDMYPDNPDRPLSSEELIEICKMQLEEPSASIHDFKQALIFIARLRKWLPENTEYTKLLNQVWIRVVKMDKWEKLKTEDMYTTNFARVIRKLLDEENDLARFALPDTTALLKFTSEEYQSPQFDEFIKSRVTQAIKNIST